jgi:hypothetical protein
MSILIRYNKMRIFVSYTTRDTEINRNLLLWISEILKSHGVPFIDVIHNDSSNRQSRVKKELDSADIVLLLKSKSIEKSKWVSWEINRAKSQDIPIIQVPINSFVNREYLNKMIDYKFRLEIHGR